MPIYSFTNTVADPWKVLRSHFVRVCLRKPLYIFVCLLFLAIVVLVIADASAFGKVGNFLVLLGMMDAVFARISVVVSSFVIEEDGSCVITLSNGAVYKTHVDTVAINIKKRSRMLAIGNQMDVVVDKKTIVHQSTILGWSDEDMVELRNVVKSMKTKKSASVTTSKKATNG